MQPELDTERVAAVFDGLTAGSKSAFDLARQLIPAGTPGGLGVRFPHTVFATRATGCYVWDADGRRLLDLMNGDWLLPAGHCHPAITAAIVDQLTRGTTFAVPDAELGLRMAAELSRRLPSLERMRFTASGTEATMFAMRLARAFTGRGTIAKAIGGYHGTSDVAMVANGHHRESAEVPLGLIPSVESHVLLLPFNDTDTTTELLRTHADDVAAVILEPILGAAGMIPASGEYLTQVREVTEELGILLILDETVTFTAGYGGVQGIYGIRPDLTALGKAIGGGLPLGVFGGRAEVMDLTDSYLPEATLQVRHGSTAGGIPVCLAAGIAALEILDKDAYQELHRLGGQIRSGITGVAAELDVPLQVTGIGHFFGLHWTDREIKGFRNEGRNQIATLVMALYNEGCLMFTNGAGVASLPMRQDDIAFLIGAVRSALRAAL